jgi:hypothetical protein
MENFEKGGSEVVPTSLGNTLTDVADGVIVECVDNVNEVVGEERALVVRSCETAEMWEKVPMRAGHVSSDVECVEPRALGDSGGAKVGSGHFLNPDGGGPVFIQPIALRTRKRDLPLAVHKGGCVVVVAPFFCRTGRVCWVLKPKWIHFLWVQVVLKVAAYPVIIIIIFLSPYHQPIDA